MPRDNTATAIRWVEQGYVPDSVIRLGIRRLIRERIEELRCGDAEAVAQQTRDFLATMRTAPLAPLPEKANEQHYEVPADFFGGVLAAHRKYSCCEWGPGIEDLDAAEAAALATTCERAGLVNGQRILELGCGWGSLSLYMAARYPASPITVVSNSHSQRAYIEGQAARRHLCNLKVITCDVNAFDTDERFDRIVSVEMFEHLRNWPAAFARVAKWLSPEGRFFMHVFVHKEAPYPFVERDASDWMTRYFFAGGMMPSDDLAMQCQDDLRLVDRWRWDGRHYARTARAWLDNMDAHRPELLPVIAAAYGANEADRWWMRWRLFFLSVEELFGWDEGQRWWVGHYLFQKR